MKRIFVTGAISLVLLGLGAVVAEAESELEAAEAQARQALDDFFEDFNAGDNDALQAHMNYPHVFVGSNASIRVIEDRLDTNFDRMREGEDWHHSVIVAAKAFLVKVDKVNFELTFTRHHADGSEYRRVSGLWIMTKKDGVWGLSLRSY